MCYTFVHPPYFEGIMFYKTKGINNMDLKKHLTRDNIIHLIIIVILMAFFLFMILINYF